LCLRRRQGVRRVFENKVRRLLVMKQRHFRYHFHEFVRPNNGRYHRKRNGAMEERLSEGLKHDLEKLERDAKGIDRTEKRLRRQIPQMERNRFAHRARRCQDEYNVERAAGQLDVDKEKCRLLKTFRDECLRPRF
jgi:hypothetical protein